MRIILDTEEKVIILPWNYSEKLKAMNKTIEEATGEKDKLKFAGYVDDIWKYAMEHSDTQLRKANRPAKPDKKKASTMLAEDDK